MTNDKKGQMTNGSNHLQEGDGIRDASARQPRRRLLGVAELGTHKTEFGFKPKMRLFFELSNELSWTAASRS